MTHVISALDRAVYLSVISHEAMTILTPCAADKAIYDAIVFILYISLFFALWVFLFLYIEDTILV